MPLRDRIVVEMKETTPGQRTAARIDYWREQVAQQERSGLPVKQFCDTQAENPSAMVIRSRLLPVVFNST
jgi:hypothetical protein